MEIAKSQIETNEFVVGLLKSWGLSQIKTPNNLVSVNKKMHSVLGFRPYISESMEAERLIRWRRTGAEVLEDGYVYQGKACTDLVVAMLTLTKAGGVSNTKFVKLKSIVTGNIHSIGEFKLGDNWYIFNVADVNAIPTKGKIEKGASWGNPPNGPYVLWEKGRDSWDLGLDRFESKKIIKI